MALLHIFCTHSDPCKTLLKAHLSLVITDGQLASLWVSLLMKSNIIPSHVLSTSPSLTSYSTELPLRAGLIHTSYIDAPNIHVFIRHVMCSKYAMK